MLVKSSEPQAWKHRSEQSRVTALSELTLKWGDSNNKPIKHESGGHMPGRIEQGREDREVTGSRGKGPLRWGGQRRSPGGGDIFHGMRGGRAFKAEGTATAKA